MGEMAERVIRIDLNEFKLHIRFKDKTALTLHFNSPSRRFYLSVIAVVVNEMKKLGRITSIPMEPHLDLLALLNETVGGSAGSSDRENLLPRIYKKWKDALPDLENAPLFKVLGRKKEYDEGIGKAYRFTDEEKDSWANLFEYKGSEENVRLRFSIDRLGIDLNGIVIVYGEYLNEEAWERFISGLKQEGEQRPEPTDLFSKEREAPAFQLRKWKIAWPGRYQWVALTVAIILIMGATTLAIWKAFLSPSDKVASVKKMAFPLPNKPSIAVLPFSNMTEDPAQDFFCDGLSEEIITALSKTPKLFVIARNSTFTYKGKSVKVQQVAEELGVQFVLEGSLRKVGDRIRITSQLTDALSGHHLWAERYDRTMKDILAIQDEITKKIVIALQVKLTQGEQARVFSHGTENLDAYLKIMEANWLLLQGTKEKIIKARQLAGEAISLDSNYALAYSTLGLYHILEIWHGLGKSPKESIMRAIEQLQKAIALDSTLAHARIRLGYIYAAMIRQHDKGIAEGEKALALAPNSADFVNLYAIILTYAGRWHEAIPLYREALRLNPIPPNNYYRHFAVALRETGQYDEAISQLKKATEKEPHDILAYLVLTSVYSYAGRQGEARAAAGEVLRIKPTFRIEQLPQGTHRDLAIVEHENEALRSAGLQ
jgi:TolB-like protein/Tfp pilus assembly protein PilF